VPQSGQIFVFPSTLELQGGSYMSAHKWGMLFSVDFI